MAGKELQLALKIEALVKGAKDVLGLTNTVKDLGATANRQIPDNTEDLRAGVKQANQDVRDLANVLGGLVSAAAITQFVRSSIDEFARAESAFRGLEAVANATGVGIGNALKEAERLAADGLISVADASKALQNLLNRGYNLDQAVGTIERLKDAAAFNRQANLSMADAVVTATEGLKNENSILVDNAGVTKNVAKMWADYAKARGLVTTELTQAQKIEAEYLGIQQETTAQLGNAQKALEGFQGQMAQSDQKVLKFKQSLGESLAPAMVGLSQIGTYVIDHALKPLNFYLQAAGIGAGFTASMIGAVWDALSSFDFSGFSKRIKAFADLAEEELQKTHDRVYGDKLKIEETLTGGADPAKAKALADSLAGPIKNASKEAIEAAEKQAIELKRSINESIRDYQNQANKLREEWKKSLQAEQDYHDKAAALRAEVAASNVEVDHSIEGQASAWLDVAAAVEKVEILRAQGASIEDVAKQSKLAQDMAKNLDDQKLAQEQINRAKLAEAGAYDKVAEAQKSSTAGLKDQWDNALKLVDDLKTALDSVGKRTVINIESDQAKAVLAEITKGLDGLQDKTVTVKVVRLDEAGNALVNLGTLPTKAGGGEISGPGQIGRDSVLMWGAPGEHMLTADEVAAAGGQAAIYRLRMAIRNGLLPHFAQGGAVLGATGSLPRLANTGLLNRIQPIQLSQTAAQESGRSVEVNLNLGDLGRYPMKAAPSVADELASVLRTAALKLGSRR